MANTNKYNKQQLNKFRKAIVQKMEQVANEMDDIQEGLNKTGSSNSSMSPDSIYSLHMADAGTDSHEREKNYLLMTRENSYFRNLRKALERIDAGDFGVCAICGELIPVERMMEVPNASKCVTCKTKEKLNLK